MIKSKGELIGKLGISISYWIKSWAPLYIVTLLYSIGYFVHQDNIPV